MLISSLGASSFTIYNGTKEVLRNHKILAQNKLLDVACIGGLGGALAGALLSFGSARKCDRSALRYLSSRFFSF